MHLLPGSWIYPLMFTMLLGVFVILTPIPPARGMHDRSPGVPVLVRALVMLVLSLSAWLVWALVRVH